MRQFTNNVAFLGRMVITEVNMKPRTFMEYETTCIVMNVVLHFINFCSRKAVTFIMIFLLIVIKGEKVCLDVLVTKTK